MPCFCPFLSDLGAGLTNFRRDAPKRAGATWQQHMTFCAAGTTHTFSFPPGGAFRGARDSHIATIGRRVSNVDQVAESAPAPSLRAYRPSSITAGTLPAFWPGCSLSSRQLDSIGIVLFRSSHHGRLLGCADCEADFSGRALFLRQGY